MRTRRKMGCRLVETNMAVFSNTQYLKINTPALGDFSLVLLTNGNWIITIFQEWQMGIFNTNVHTIKKLSPHVRSIAAFVFLGNINILIKIEGCHSGKVNSARLMSRNQFTI